MNPVETAKLMKTCSSTYFGPIWFQKGPQNMSPGVPYAMHF